MNEKVKAYLAIEKLTKGKIAGYDLWDEIPLSTKAIVLGRPGINLEAISPDIKIIGDDYITRGQHVEIFFNFNENCYMIRDDHSRNDTFLNGQILEKSKPYRLKSRDLIGLAKIGGETRIDFRFKLYDEDGTLAAWADEQGKRPSKKGLHINPDTKMVSVDGREITLTKTELKLLELLYENKGKACNIDDIAWEIWGKEAAASELVSQHIHRLREKIEPDPTKPRYIVLVPGRHSCYRLEE
jgi:hypothetical protein